MALNLTYPVAVFAVKRPDINARGKSTVFGRSKRTIPADRRNDESLRRQISRAWPDRIAAQKLAAAICEGAVSLKRKGHIGGKPSQSDNGGKPLLPTVKPLKVHHVHVVQDGSSRGLRS